MTESAIPTAEIQLQRTPEVQADFGDPSRSTIYRWVAAGTLPPPVKISLRMVAWLKHENDAVKAARSAGKSDEEIRDLVSRLVAARDERAAARIASLTAQPPHAA